VLISTLAAGAMIAAHVGSKAARDGLFLAHFSPSALPAAVIGSALVSLVLALVAARVASRRSPLQFTAGSFLASALFLGLEWVLFPRAPRAAAVLVYLHVAVFGAMLVSGFWTLLVELFDPRTARRSMGRIALGAAVGGLLGGILTERTSAWAGVAAPLPILGLCHVVCAALVWSLRSSFPDISKRAIPREAAATSDAALGFRFVRGSSYLRALALLVFVQAIAAAVLDFAFKAQVAASVPPGPGLVRFFALFHTATSLATILVQLSVVSPLLTRTGLSRTLAAFPSAVALGSVVAALQPGLGTLVFARGTEQALRGSVFRSAYELMFSPLSGLERRVTKPLIDVVTERLGDLSGAALVQLALGLGVSILSPGFAGAALGLAAIGAALALTLKTGWFRALERSLSDLDAARPSGAGETATLRLGESMLLSLGGTGLASGAAREPTTADLLASLRDARFEERVRAGRALARRALHSAGLTFDRALIEEAIVQEAAVGRQVWTAREHLEHDSGDALPVERDFIRDRSDRSLAHVFTLLSLILPREPLRVAYRGLHTRDARLRGTALEYLDAVLPARVKEMLWPHLEAGPERRGTPRAPEEILRDLMGASDTIALRLDEIRRKPPGGRVP